MFSHDVREAWGSRRARGWENRQPQPQPCALPGASSSFKCCLPGSSARALPPRRHFAMLGRKVPSLVLRVSAGAGEPGLLRGLPGSPHRQAWPGSLPPFTSAPEAGSPSRLAAPRDPHFSTNLWSHALGLQASISGFGVSASAPLLVAEADAGP